MSWNIDEQYWPGPPEGEEFSEAGIRLLHPRSTWTVSRSDTILLTVDRGEWEVTSVGELVGIAGPFSNGKPVGIVREKSRTADPRQYKLLIGIAQNAAPTVPRVIRSGDTITVTYASTVSSS